MRPLLRLCPLFAWMLLALMMLPSLLLAAEGDPAPGGGSAQFDIWTYVIPFLTPVIVMGVKWLAPRLPNLVVVLSATMIPVAISAIQAFLTTAAFDPKLGIMLGLASIGLRELADQTKQTVQGTAGTPAESAAYEAQVKAAKAASG